VNTFTNFSWLLAHRVNNKCEIKMVSSIRTMNNPDAISPPVPTEFFFWFYYPATLLEFFKNFPFLRCHAIQFSRCEKEPLQLKQLFLFIARTLRPRHRRANECHPDNHRQDSGYWDNEYSYRPGKCYRHHRNRNRRDNRHCRASSGD
jgi:hypothetical protein